MTCRCGEPLETPADIEEGKEAAKHVALLCVDRGLPDLAVKVLRRAAYRAEFQLAGKCPVCAYMEVRDSLEEE